MARVVVVGLGPAGADLLLPAARAALARGARRFVRTARHPAVDDLAAEGIVCESFDAVYEEEADLDTVYRRIADELVAAALQEGEVVYAVPGSPAVAETSVAVLRERAAAGQVELDVRPGLSFVDLAWTRLGVDPLDGARVLDAHALDPADLEIGGPALIAQLDTPLVCSDVKLALLDRLAPDAPATVLQRLGGPDEHVVTVPLAELDRAIEPDHLTACMVVLPPGSGDRFGALVALARRLRGPGGCPWDAEQTHHSLTRYLLEEAYEVVEAIEALPADDELPPARTDPAVWAALADELGDLLFQVVFHSVLAEEKHAFAASDVARGIHDKLVRRHPHVFGDVVVGSAGEVVRNWEQIKKEERGAESLVDEVPRGLPALLYVHKLFRKAASIGLDPGDREAALAQLDHALDAARTQGRAGAEAMVGEILAAAVMLARASGVDAESALRGWSARYRSRFLRMEALARSRSLDLSALAVEEVRALWAEVDVAEGGGGDG